MRKLKWVFEFSKGNVFRCNANGWEVFMGPYIDDSETGYIIQAIHSYSRKVVSVPIPFTEDVNMEVVREKMVRVFGGQI